MGDTRFGVIGRHDRKSAQKQTVSLEGIDSGDAPVIVSRGCDYGGHNQLRIHFGHVPIRDLLDIEFRPIFAPECRHSSRTRGLRARRHLCRAGSCVLLPLRSAVNPRAIAGAEVAEECHGRVDLRLVQRPSALFRVREKRSAVAVGVGVSVPTDLEGGVPLGKPADAKAEHLIVGFAHRAPPLEAPSARLALRGFRRTSFHQRRERVGAPPGGGAPSPAMSVAVCDGEPSEGRGLQRLDARRLLVAHDEGAVAQPLRSSHLARLRYVKCSVHVSLTSGQSTFSTVW